MGISRLLDRSAAALGAYAVPGLWTLAALAVSVAIVSSATADDQNPGQDKELHRYLLDRARQHFDARRQAIAALKTPEDIGRRQRALRAFFRESLGDLPARTPLYPRVVGTLDRDGYRVEKVIFESRPNHHVTANLYAPDGQGPFPGVLLPCGHSDNGKAFEGYQRACILLAKNGMVVLCYDPVGQGERYQMLDPKGKPIVRGTTEHTMAGIGALWSGDNWHRTASGTACEPSTTWRAGPKWIPRAWAARATLAAAR